MKYLVIFTFLITSVRSNGQDFSLNQSRLGFYNTYWKNPDSALVYAREVAKDPANILVLRQLLHEDVFYYFHEKTKQQARVNAEKKASFDFDQKQFEKEYLEFLWPLNETLVKLASDSNELLSTSTRPILYWVKVQQNENNVEEVKKLVLEFISNELSQSDLYYNCSALYALYIYQIISKNIELKETAFYLLKKTVDKLKEVQITESVNALSFTELEKRTWYRYLYSTANHLLAEEMVRQGKKNEAAGYFKNAFDYSPDVSDIMFSDIYGKIKHFINNDKDEKLYESYFDYLITVNNATNIILESYTKQALKTPAIMKDTLHFYYNANFSDGIPFKEYWENEINNNYETTPNTDFFSKNNSNWNLLVFWGTWCGPCRAEHPDLQRFYEDVTLKYQSNITINTIACHDTQEKVKNYMNENNYTFPVLLSDGKIESSFNVHGYPTMFLISPKGKYLKIPTIAFDWIQFVKDYASLSEN